MSELWKIILTSSITIISGILIFVIGDFLKSLFVEPIHILRGLIGEIADSLVYHANIYSNPGIVDKEKMDRFAPILRSICAR